MAKHSVLHTVYLLIIAVLVVLMLWPDTVSEPESVPTVLYEPTPATEQHAPGQERPASAPVDPIRNEPDQYNTEQLLQAIAERDAAIDALEARISQLEVSLSQAQQSQSATVEEQQARELSEDEYMELSDAYRQQQATERAQAFANAQPTSNSDRTQQQLETSFYRIDNLPRFEDLNIECRDIYCDIEVTFDNRDLALEFLRYHNQRVFDHADIRTTMTNTSMRGNMVIMKADLAPPLEE